MQLAKPNALKGFDINSSGTKNMACTGCVLAKRHQQVFPQKANPPSTKVLELVHSDVNGPIEVSSLVELAISSLLSMTILGGRPYTL